MKGPFALMLAVIALISACSRASADVDPRAIESKYGAGAGAAIGAIAGGKKGAGVGALSGGIAGLVYDLATRNKK